MAAALAAVYFRGMFLDVMEVDAAQYASISMEMHHNGHWLQVQHRGADYLDKPPLLFWLSAVSFALFGVSNWAYKLPSVLAALLGVWSVYRFAKLYYPESVARWAAFILAASLGLMLICNDVRTDTLLLGFSTCAVWQLAAYLESRRWLFLISGFGCIGLAMLAKGPIGLVMPAFAVGGHLLLQWRWREVFRWEWLVGLLIVAVILAPMCWGLWHQFDLHPEKWVNGRQGVSGLRFFFWEQSFGRITGENVWKNDASVLYFVHVYLWAFLPWSLLLFWALIKFGRAAWAAQKERAAIAWPEYYSLSGFLLTFIALSFSQYKLPHYIFITLPWASVIVASMLSESIGRWPRIWLIIGASASLLIAWLIVIWVFPSRELWLWLLLGSGTLFWVVYGLKNQFPTSERLIQWGVSAAWLLGLVLNFHFYPHLLPYQCARKAIAAAREQGISAEALYCFRFNSHTVDFYNGRILPQIDEPEGLKSHITAERRPIGVFTTPEGLAAIEQAGLVIERVTALRHFHVAMLNAKFLNPASRSETLQTFYLLKIRPSIQEH